VYKCWKSNIVLDDLDVFLDEGAASVEFCEFGFGEVCVMVEFLDQILKGCVHG
jgi:hypothetical protein